MASFKTESIRTLALVGQSASGKTCLAEAILHKAGAIGATGSLERGTTVCDHDPLERKFQHSLSSAITHFENGGARVHMIDTPGYPDFMGQAMTALEAVETAAVVISAADGIGMITTRMMEWAKQRGLDRMIIVNKIDHEGVDLPGLVAQIQDAFGRECMPINLPANGATRVVDCFFNPAGESDFGSVEAAHRALIDQVVEVDPKWMETYLEQGDVDPKELHEPLEQAMREGHLVPICFVSARTGAGIQDLIDVIVKLMPNPTESNPPQFLKGEGEAAEPMAASTPDPSKHVLAHVFKVAVDPYVGKLGVFRIYQGTVTRDSQLYIGDGRKPFKVGHLFLLQGKDHIEIQQGVPGDICAVAKVDELTFDAVLHDAAEDDHIHLRPIKLPTPIYGQAIETKKRGDEQRLWEVLAKLTAEDPCLKVEHVANTNETVIFGLGELHLRVMLERMADTYKLEVATRPPKIAYRETITAAAEGHHRHKKQTGGAGQFGEVFLKIEPMERGGGFEFVDRVKGGTIPTQFIPAVEKGIRQVLDVGPLAGYPVQDVRVIVYDGKHHPVDSKEVAFVTAGKKAFIDAMLKARPIMLEPVVNIEITVQDQHMGDITGDLSAKRGQVNGTNSVGGGTVTIAGQVPLSELSGYQTRLNSVTGGQGSYTLELSHYDAVPPGVQKNLMEAYKPKVEE
jgi:elongation factor G